MYASYLNLPLDYVLLGGLVSQEVSDRLKVVLESTKRVVRLVTLAQSEACGSETTGFGCCASTASSLSISLARCRARGPESRRQSEMGGRRRKFFCFCLVQLVHVVYVSLLIPARDGGLGLETPSASFACEAWC